MKKLLLLFFTLLLPLVANADAYNVKIDEVVDHYDKKMYSFDGKLNGDTYKQYEYNESNESRSRSYAE